MLEVINKDTRMTSVFIVNFEHISHLVLVFLLLNLNMQLPPGNVLPAHEQKQNQLLL